jgi:hypothetical protein
MSALKELVEQLRIAMRNRQRDSMPPNMVLTTQDVKLLCDASDALFTLVTLDSRDLNSACELALQGNEYPQIETIKCASGSIRQFVLARRIAKRLIESGELPK